MPFTHSIEPPDGRHVYGHGVFSRDGRLVYATENDFDGGRGVIGIYDARRDCRRIGELSAHGIGPHEIGLLPDGDTLVVTNGGIATHPDLPRIKLNFVDMEPSLCLVDRNDGTLLRKLVLPSSLNRLSIRHLAVGPQGMVGIAMQYEGFPGDPVPLVALQQGEGNLHLLRGADTVLRAMKNYCGSACFDPGGDILAVSAPRGGLVTFWNVDDGHCLSSIRVDDGCGVAPGEEAGRFVISSSREGALTVDMRSGDIEPLTLADFESAGWDNHLAAV